MAHAFPPAADRTSGSSPSEREARSMNYDRTFFQRVARENEVQIDLMNRSVVKLAESRKLLAEVSDLLRG